MAGAGRRVETCDVAGDEAIVRTFVPIVYQQVVTAQPGGKVCLFPQLSVLRLNRCRLRYGCLLRRLAFH